MLTDMDNRWPVVILQHSLESRHPLNTAKIAQLCLQQCTTIVAGDDARVSASVMPRLDTAAMPVLIYPGANSRPLAELDADTPVPLLFIDASWRKSRRLLLQSPWLQSLPRYGFAPEGSGRYRIRKEPRPGLRSTLEAIVAVLSDLEDCPVQDMLGIMDWMVDRQLDAMSPDTRQRHYPAAG